MEKLDAIVSLSKTMDCELETGKEKEILSFDGKAGNGSGRKETDIAGAKQLHTLNVYSSDYGFCLTQTFVDEKSNEITSMPEILSRLDLRNTLATWDALNTQKEVVQAVITGKGDYVGALKTIEKNNPKQPIVEETRYFISSVTDISEYSRAVRSHWGVENGLHWHLDFTFNDDKNTTMAKNGAKGLQVMKKLGLAILKMAQCLYPKRTSLKMIRFQLAMSFENEIGRIFSMMNIANLAIAK